MIRFLFVLPLIVVSVGVEAQPWVTHCNGIPHPSTRTPYTVVSADDQGDCRWRRNDGAQLRTDPEAIQTFMERFNRAQTWLLASGFRPPAYPFRQGEDFQLHIVLAGQGVCFSVREQTVCTSEAPADPFEVRRLRAGDDEANALFLRSDALETDDPDEVLREALTALMRLTLISYEGYAPDGGAPGGWLSTGYAMAFANWWMRRHEDASGLYDLADESLGETITSNAATVGAANLWVNAALRTRHGGWENPDAFATLRIVPEAVERAEQAGEDPLPHVDGVLREHYGLRREEESGLGVALEMFTRFSTRDVWPVMPQVAPDEDLLVVPEGPPVSRRVIGHEPLAVVRIPVSIPRSDDGLQGITITVEDATESLRWGNRHIIQRVLPEDVPTDVFHTNTLNSCPEPGPACEFDLVFVNAHPEDAERTTPATYTVTVQAGRDCTFPEGATGVSYAVSRGTRQERVARMDLDLPESLFGAMTQIEGTFTLETPVDGGRTLRYDLTGALQCTGSGVRLKDVRVHGFMAGDAIASAVSTGPELEIPQYADVGTQLPDVTQRFDADVHGEQALESSGTLTSLEVTEITTREIVGVDGPVTVWKIEGVSVSRTGLVGDAFAEAVDREGAEVREGMDTTLDDYNTTAREAVRETVDGVSGSARMPVTIYYSPVYGSVETITGRGAEMSTMRLIEVRRDE